MTDLSDEDVFGPAAAAPKAAPAFGAHTPQDRDALARMLATEAIGEGEQGMAAAGHVAMNRLRTGYGKAKSLRDVVYAPSQFEGMSRADQVRPEDLNTAGAVADRILSGELPDPTGGAINFLNPELQSHLGRAQPDWATGQGTRIGRHVFYGGKGGADVQMTSGPAPEGVELSDADIFGGGDDAAAGVPPAARPRQLVINPETGKAYPEEIQAQYGAMMDSGELDPGAKVGSKRFPRAMVAGGEPIPGEWYVDGTGVHQMPGGEAPEYSLAKSFTDPITQPAESLQRNFGRWYEANSTPKAPTSWRDFVPGFSESDKALGSMAKDAASLVGGLAGGAVLNAGIVEPGARLLDKLPAPDKLSWEGGLPFRGGHVVAQRQTKEQQHETNREIFNTALSGGRPAVAGPLAPQLPQRLGPRVEPAELRKQAKAHYTELANRGVQFTPQAAQHLDDGLTDLLRAEDPAGNLFGEHRNWVGNVRAQMQADPSVENLDRVRSNLQKALTTPTAASDPNSLRIGSAMVDEIDNFLAASARNPAQMTTATPADAKRVQELLLGARDAWRRMRNVETVENLAESAGIRNATTHMGGNEQNFTKQKLRALIDPSNHRELSKLSPAERTQLERVVMGTKGTKALKALGNLSPTKGIGALVNTMLAGTVGLAGPAIVAPIGYAANLAGASAQGRQLDRLLRLLAGGGPRPNAPLPATLRAAGPAGLAAASATSRPLDPKPVQKARAKSR